MGQREAWMGGKDTGRDTLGDVSINPFYFAIQKLLLGEAGAGREEQLTLSESLGVPSTDVALGAIS